MTYDDGWVEVPEPKKPSQAKRLLEVLEGVELWHDPDREGFASVKIKRHFENYRIRSKPFKTWLVRQYHQKHNGVPGGQAIEDALKFFEASAIHDHPEHATWLRIGEAGGAVYIDIGDDSWQAIKITSKGWKVINRAPIKFLRTNAMRAMYRPESGGSLDDLKKFINIENEGDFKLIVGFMVGLLRGRGPYQILVLGGEQGSAKSTVTKVIRRLIDPNKAPARSPPRDERELMVMARNTFVIALDNLSNVAGWLADGLCRLATGGGFGSRELFTDFSEVVFDGQRPTILNGIPPDLAARADLADRALLIALPAIEDSKRKRESTFWDDFDAAAPGILGALLDAVSGALERLPTVPCEDLPRMADSAIFVTAAEAALGWYHGDFIEAYRLNRSDASEMSLDADTVAVAIRNCLGKEPTNGYARKDGGFAGTASEVLADLESCVHNERIKNSRAWPRAPNVFSRRLRRLAVPLRRVGIEVSMAKADTDNGRRMIIKIARQLDSSAPEAAGEDSGDIEDWGEIAPPAP